MSWLTALAVYFIIWWITLFLVLPIGVKTQADRRDVVLGTAESAPHKHNIPFKLVLTTVISALLLGIYYAAVSIFGLGVDSIPRIVPDFPGTR